MLWVAMETRATAYISIHRVSPPRRGTSRRIINIGTVLLVAVTNYGGVVWSGVAAAVPVSLAAAKVRLISLAN